MEISNYQQSMVGWDSTLDDLVVSNYRTSRSYHDTERKFNKVTSLLLNQVFRQTGHRYSLEQTEPIQLTSYLPGEYFMSHWDHFNTNDPPEITDRAENDRIATIILYLNDDFEGGETFFNRLNVTIKPQRGKICYFSYPIETDTINLEHEAKPVISGEKKILQIWIRNDEWNG
jgi:prolyl 4-hydroxylase